MALQLNWEDEDTGVTYNSAYAIINRLTYEKAEDDDYRVHAVVLIYKDSTAHTEGKSFIARTQFTTTVTIQSSDNGTTYRNPLNQVYEDMKLVAPWDSATNA